MVWIHFAEQQGATARLEFSNFKFEAGIVLPEMW